LIMLVANGTSRLQGKQCRGRVVRARRLECSAKSQKKAVVIGGGIGGLVTAGRLARDGLDVTLLEQNSEVSPVDLGQQRNRAAHRYSYACAMMNAGTLSQVGGRCQSIDRDGYRFDTGPSLLLFPDTYRKVSACHEIELFVTRVPRADPVASSDLESIATYL
jgi:hypothetical protein